jgi:hypothetical protein
MIGRELFAQPLGLGEDPERRHSAHCMSNSMLRSGRLFSIPGFVRFVVAVAP